MKKKQAEAKPKKATHAEKEQPVTHASSGPHRDYAVNTTPHILVEGVDGGEPVALKANVAAGERVIHVDGIAYEHCADAVDGRWVYRAVEK